MRFDCAWNEPHSLMIRNKLYAPFECWWLCTSDSGANIDECIQFNVCWRYIHSKYENCMHTPSAKSVQTFYVTSLVPIPLFSSVVIVDVFCICMGFLQMVKTFNISLRLPDCTVWFLYTRFYSCDYFVLWFLRIFIHFHIIQVDSFVFLHTILIRLSFHVWINKIHKSK